MVKEVFTMDYVEITHDTFDIAKRVKALDSNYFILYNKKTCKYEIWYRCGTNATRELVIPYSCLDVRTIKKVQASRMENSKKILDEMEQHNEKLHEKQNKKLADELKCKVKMLCKIYY